MKSSYSHPDGAMCVDVEPAQNCLFSDDCAVHVTDMKSKRAPILHFTIGEWEVFVRTVKEGYFDVEKILEAT